MNGLWIILVMAGIVLPLFARFKRTMAEPVDSADETARMESNDESDDSFFDFGDTETEETVAQPQPYFTYETREDESAPKAVHKQAKAAPKPMQEAPVNEQAFDLRQAIIYQTLLNNKYINAGN